MLLQETSSIIEYFSRFLFEVVDVILDDILVRIEMLDSFMLGVEKLGFGLCLFILLYYYTT